MIHLGMVQIGVTVCTSFMFKTVTLFRTNFEPCLKLINLEGEDALQRLISQDELPWLKVLVIDPDQELSEFLRVWLGPANCQVEGCQSGREGREIARRILPDLIILELLFPDMDGLDLCRQLHEEATLGKCPLLVLTQLNIEQIQTRAKEAGASIVIAKPFSFVGLLPVIEFLTHRLPPGKGWAYPHIKGFEEHVLQPQHPPAWLLARPAFFKTSSCPSCGAELRSGDNFCLTCGKWLTSGEE